MGWTEPQLSANPPPYDPEHPYKDPVALLEERERRSFRKEVEVEKAKVGSASGWIPREAIMQLTREQRTCNANC